MARLTHTDTKGRARMVDVGDKTPTRREAVARGAVTMSAEAIDRVARNSLIKGDVLTVAQVAGIQAAKRTSELIPLCHPLPLDGVAVDLEIDRPARAVRIEARARTRAATGVEMEALTAVAVAALAVYDMIKSADRTAVIGSIRLIRKTGGKSGTYRRAGG
ncbi:MAG TPA: cyclic pyranopterin monophosphate synthase MoaC [Candidatus Polarisedimenticolia bacterium]|nr:cyclic pyranopterin monophosphate synthase MoaC [Candidatus Polarisedimenticolia bacterium]